MKQSIAGEGDKTNAVVAWTEAFLDLVLQRPLVMVTEGEWEGRPVGIATAVTGLGGEATMVARQRSRRRHDCGECPGHTEPDCCQCL
eukprot:2919380-Rhodomonas_salina.1